MATGDSTDIFTRLKGYLPRGWFGDTSPIRDALLVGAAAIFAPIYALYIYAKAQTRIATASDGWLDLIAYDFYGTSLLRGSQSDDTYRSAIQINLFRERGTRKAVNDILTQLTGQAPIIFEPGRPEDTGGYDEPEGLAYDVAGGYGELLTAQAFIIAYRPQGTGIASVSGYDQVAGGYDGGVIEYIDDTMYGGATADEQIYAAVNAVRPIGVTLWVQIQTHVPSYQLVTSTGVPVFTANSVPIYAIAL